MDKKSKRKREETEADDKKKSKKSKDESRNCLKLKASDNGQDAIAKKLAKLKPTEKAEYEARAAAKGQTLEQYVLRRIQKKMEKNAAERSDATKAKKLKDAVKKKEKKSNHAAKEQ